MLTADQQHAVRKLVPKVEEFLNQECRTQQPKKLIRSLVESAIEEGEIYGLIKIETFTLGNAEGMRVQYGNAVKYFKLKSEGH